MNRYLLNDRRPLLKAGQKKKKFRYDVKTWKTAPQLAEEFLSLVVHSKNPEEGDEFSTLRLCFMLDYDVLFTRCMAHVWQKK